MAHVAGNGGELRAAVSGEQVALARHPRKPRSWVVGVLERYGSLLLAALVLLAWQLAVPILGLSPFVLPTPLAIAKRMFSDAPLLGLQAWYTTLEVVAGFGAAVLA